MTAWAAPTFAPPSAIRIWCDARRIYCELPGSPPYIIWFYNHEGGLAKALATLNSHSMAAGPTYPGPAPEPVTLAAKLLREAGIL